MTKSLKYAVFVGQSATEMAPDPDAVAGFNAYIKRYCNGLAVERAAVDTL